jgi:hypothetical protein
MEKSKFSTDHSERHLLLAHFLLSFLFLFFLNCGGGGGSEGGGGGGDGGETFTPTLGSWAGENISFSLIQGSLLVNSLSITYSGMANGTECSYSYEATLTNRTTIQVIDNAFTLEGPILMGEDKPEYLIDGIFTSATTAEVNFSWSKFDSRCNAWETGDKDYYANYADSNLNTYYRDADGDGYGDPNNSIEADSHPTGYVSSNSDCDDTNADIHPNALEICEDGINQDCNEYIDCDEKLTPNQKIFDSVNREEWKYYEIDLSSNKDLEIKLTNLTSDVDLYVKKDGQPNLDDYDCRPYKGGTEEETCSFENEGYTTWYIGVYGYDGGSYELHVLIILSTWYKDSDGDGYGDPNDSIEAESQPSGYVSDDSDCDDNNVDIHPDAIEVCNDGIDQNCDGDTDCPIWHIDNDGDGYGNPDISIKSPAQPAGYVSDATDCDDNNGDINPGKSENCNDNIDNDCNGAVDDEDLECRGTRCCVCVCAYFTISTRPLEPVANCDYICDTQCTNNDLGPLQYSYPCN